MSKESWEERFRKLKEEAEKAGQSVISMLPEQQKRVEDCDAEVTKVYAKYRCVPIVIENQVKVNGQVQMTNVEIKPAPMELMQAPPQSSIDPTVQ